VDAHGYGKRFIVRAEEILTAFLELESAVVHQENKSNGSQLLADLAVRH